MRFKRLDLNLLVALDALLAEQSVSAAAERMLLSQPAMSGALSRLRDYFQDDLLVLSGRRMVLTPRAAELAGPVRAALVQIETTVSSPPVFDPAACARRFVMEASDYISEVLIAPIARRFTTVAPHLTLEIIPHRSSSESALESGEIDLVITPESYASAQQPAEFLFEDDHVVVGWSENPKLKGAFSADDFYSLGHVAVHFDKGRQAAFAESHVRDRDRVRRVEVSVPTFSEAPRFIIGTQRIAILHRRLAVAFCRYYPLTMRPSPFEIPPLREVMQHHRIRGTDQALTWLRGELLDAAAASSVSENPPI